MNKRHYTRKKKFGVLLAFILCLCITAGGLLGLYYVNNFSDYLFSKSELLKYRSFDQTETLERKLLGDTERLFRYTLLRRTFGDNDQQNRRTLLYQVAVSGSQYKLCLKDLQKIEAALEEAQRNGTENVPSAVILENGEILVVDSSTTVQLLYDFVQREDVNEIADFSDLANRGHELLTNYYSLRENFAETQTNLSFVIYNEEAGLQETNIASLEHEEITLREAVERIRGLGRYIIFDYVDHDTGSNFEKADISYWNLEETATNIAGMNEGVSFAVGLDMTYAASDDYRSMAENYSYCRPILVASIPAIIIGLIAALICFIYLLASVGHHEDFDEIRLDKFDQWPTEVSAIMIIGGILLLNWAGSVMAKVIGRMFFTSSLIDYVVQALSLVVTVIIAMVGFFSMVKRLKAGVLWKHSFLCAILRKLGHFFAALAAGWKTSVRVTLLVFLYWLITIPLSMSMAIYSQRTPKLFLALEILIFAAAQLAAAGSVIWIYIKRKDILEGVEEIAVGNLEYEIDSTGMFPGDKQLAEDINNIGMGLQEALDAAVRSERMKADLITNVSHDIKTPLTSIINYVNLMKRHKVDDPVLERYINILEEKSNRLRVLTEDLVEASRASSGNVNLDMERINYVEIVRQACGEFEERFEEKALRQVVSLPDAPVFIYADGRRLWRILENLFVNAYKYAMHGTRVYISVESDGSYAAFTMKNISEAALTTSPVDLTERFTRGDSSRTTEGSGLGLSIAKDLTELMGGYFDIYLNGDLYQVTVQFDLYAEEPEKTGENETSEG